MIDLDDWTDCPDTPEQTDDVPELEGLDAAEDSFDLTGTEDPKYIEFREQMLRMNPDMGEETLRALSKSVDSRTPREVELVDLARHPGYEDQLSFATDDVTGEALLDENGDLVRVPRNTPGSQRPDGALQLEDGTWDFRECKTYTGSSARSNLCTTIREQYGARCAALGENQHTTFVIAANDLTVSDADHLQKKAQEHGCEIEFQTK